MAPSVEIVKPVIANIDRGNGLLGMAQPTDATDDEGFLACEGLPMPEGALAWTLTIRDGNGDTHRTARRGDYEYSVYAWHSCDHRGRGVHAAVLSVALIGADAPVALQCTRAPVALHVFADDFAARRYAERWDTTPWDPWDTASMDGH